MIKLRHRVEKLFLLSVVYLTLAFNSHAKNIVTVKPFADLSSRSHESWANILANPQKSDELWLLSKSGYIYTLSNGKLNSENSIHLGEYLNRLEHFEQLVLHPNFLRKEEVGYYTFYTAHVEKSAYNKTREGFESKNKTFSFDIVFLEWKMTSIEPLSIKKPPRQVHRLASPSKHALKFLGFNSQLKPWHKNAGLMHFVFTKLDGFESHPIYSGSVHLIDPLPFGLKPFSVPKSNPFTAETDLANTTVLSGIGNIEQAFWSKSSEDSIILKRTQEERLVLSEIKYGQDYRNKQIQARGISFVDSGIKTNLVQYNGNALSHLQNKHVYLSKSSAWQLRGMSFDQYNKPETVSKINSHQLGENDDLSLFYINKTDQLLVLNNDEKTIITLSLQTENQPPNQEQESTEWQKYKTIFYSVFIFALLAIFYGMMRKSELSLIKKMLYKQFAKFSISTCGNTLSLYQRHQVKPSNTIAITDITFAELILDDQTFKLFDLANNITINNQREYDLQKVITAIKRHKMTDDKVREVHLNLTTKNKKSFRGCIYLRKGNQRLTKVKYTETLEHSLILFWHLAATHFPDSTEKRVQNVHANKASRVISSKPEQAYNPIKNEKKPEEQPAINTSASIQDIPSQVQHDSEVINALNNLAQMKQDGLLTEQEFNDAKTKLLKKLV